MSAMATYLLISTVLFMLSAKKVSASDVDHTEINLKVNEAYLTVNVTSNDVVNLEVLTLLSECDKCPYTKQGFVNTSETLSLIVSAVYDTTIALLEQNSSLGCRITCSFQDGSINVLYAQKMDHGNYSCDVKKTRDGYSIYWPIIIAVLVYGGAAALWIFGKLLYRYNVFSMIYRRGSMEVTLDMAIPNGNQKGYQRRERLRSLDTFRGIAIVIMIFVNYGGGKYWIFQHAPWNGLTIADLVFPWFIWIMGVSMAMSMRSLLRKSIPHRKIFKKILKRSITLFALGLILNTYGGHNDLQQLRILGVLQRFGICYLIVATLHLFFAKPEDTHQEVPWAVIRDIWLYKVEWLIMLGLLLLHILLTFLVEPQDCPRGYLGPGGLHMNAIYENCTGGAAGYIDRVILGKNHLYQRSTIMRIYSTTLPYDPEGILGCLTSVFLVYIGLQAGKILLTYKTCRSRIIRWLVWAVITGVIAVILCKGAKNDGWIPVNKNLWSVSYIMATGSLAFVLLTVCYYVCDVKRWWTGSPFFYAGMNSILLYVGHELTGDLFPWSWKTGQTHGDLLAVNLVGTTLWTIIAYCLYKNQFFLAV